MFIFAWLDHAMFFNLPPLPTTSLSKTTWLVPHENYRYPFVNYIVFQYCSAMFVPTDEHSLLEFLQCLFLLFSYNAYIHLYSHISGWIFQKVLAETVHKDLILSQKALISRRRNLGLFAPTSMGFPSKDSKWKDLSF